MDRVRMRGSRELHKIDTKGSCLLCLNFKDAKGSPVPVELEEDGRTGPSKYKQLLDHLGVDILKMYAFTSVWKGDKSRVTLDLKVTICQNCSSIISEFLVWFEEMERVNAHLYQCALKLSQTIEESEGDAARVKEYKKRSDTQCFGNLATAQLVESLRMETMMKCKSRVSASVPIIVLDDNDDSVPGNGTRGSVPASTSQLEATPGTIHINLKEVDNLTGVPARNEDRNRRADDFQARSASGLSVSGGVGVGVPAGTAATCENVLDRNSNGQGNQTDSQGTSSASGPSGGIEINSVDNVNLVVQVTTSNGGNTHRSAVEKSTVTNATNVASQEDQNEEVVDAGMNQVTHPIPENNTTEASTAAISARAEVGNAEECGPANDPSKKNANTTTMPVSLVQTGSSFQSENVEVMLSTEGRSSARCRIMTRKRTANVATTTKMSYAKASVAPAPPPVSDVDVEQADSNDVSRFSASEHRNDGRTLEMESERFTGSRPSISVSQSSSHNVNESVSEQAHTSSATGSNLEEYNVGGMEGLDAPRVQPNSTDPSSWLVESTAAAPKRVPTKQSLSGVNDAPCEISPRASSSVGIHTVSAGTRLESTQKSISSMTASQIASNLQISTSSTLQSADWTPQEAAAVMTEQVGVNGSGRASTKRQSERVASSISKKQKLDPSTVTLKQFTCKQCLKSLKTMLALTAHKIVKHPFSQVVAKLPPYSYEAEFETHVKEMMEEAVLKGECSPCVRKNNSYVPSIGHVRMHLLHKHMNYVVREFCQKKSRGQVESESESGANTE